MLGAPGQAWRGCLPPTALYIITIVGRVSLAPCPRQNPNAQQRAKITGWGERDQGQPRARPDALPGSRSCSRAPGLSARMRAEGGSSQGQGGPAWLPLPTPASRSVWLWAKATPVGGWVPTAWRAQKMSGHPLQSCFSLLSQ